MQDMAVTNEEALSDQSLAEIKQRIRDKQAEMVPERTVTHITYWGLVHARWDVIPHKRKDNNLRWRCFGTVPGDTGKPSHSVFGVLIDGTQEDQTAIEETVTSRFGKDAATVFLSPKPLGFRPDCMNECWSD